MRLGMEDERWDEVPKSHGGCGEAGESWPWINGTFWDGGFHGSRGVMIVVNNGKIMVNNEKIKWLIMGRSSG